MRKLTFPLLILALTFGLIACEGTTDTPEEEQQDRRVEGVRGLIERQPIPAMDFSPTRESIARWADYWDEPGKLAYVYLTAANGQPMGYYVLEGLPVNYCATGLPPYDINSHSYGRVLVPQPSMDGAWYSPDGCGSQFYGWDATTGNYVEWSQGASRDFLLYGEPLPNQDVEPLGFTTIEEAQALEAQNAQE